MELELFTTKCVFSNLSRDTFLELLSESFEMSEDYHVEDSTINGYTSKKVKYWIFADLGIDFAIYVDTDKEMEDFMKELK